AVNAPVVFASGGTVGGSGAGALTLADLTASDGLLTIGRNVTVGTLRLGDDNGTVGATVNSGTNVITLTGDIAFASTPLVGTAPPPTLAGTITLTAGNHTFFSQEYSSNLTSPYIDFTISAKLQGPGGFVKRGSATDDIAWLLLTNQNTYA